MLAQLLACESNARVDGVRTRADHAGDLGGAPSFDLAQHERHALGFVERLEETLHREGGLTSLHRLGASSDVGDRVGRELALMSSLRASIVRGDAAGDAEEPRLHRRRGVERLETTVNGDPQVLRRVIDRGRGHAESSQARPGEPEVLSIQRREVGCDLQRAARHARHASILDGRLRQNPSRHFKKGAARITRAQYRTRSQQWAARTAGTRSRAGRGR